MVHARREPRSSAVKAVAAVFGVGCGLGGIHHGVGEILQGSLPPTGIVFLSWTQGPVAANLGGEPAMTVIPNLLATGIACLTVSALVIVWSLGFLGRKRAGLILMLLSALLLLVGGGFAPPVTGILAGVAGLGIHSRHRWWRTHVSERVLRVLSGSWSWFFSVSVVNAVFLFLGSMILVYLFNFHMPDLFVYSFLISVVLIVLDIITGTARDVLSSS